MPFGNLSGWHLLIIVGVVVLLFGATKLPVFSKNLGQSIKIFRKEIHEVKTDAAEDRRRDERKAEPEPVHVTTETSAPAARRVDDAPSDGTSGR